MTVQSTILAKKDEEIKEIEQKLKHQTLYLKTPRAHMEFLKKNGKLEEFIEAKLQGKDAVAKWNLLETAAPEIK